VLVLGEKQFLIGDRGTIAFRAFTLILPTATTTTFSPNAMHGEDQPQHHQQYKERFFHKLKKMTFSPVESTPENDVVGSKFGRFCSSFIFIFDRTV